MPSSSRRSRAAPAAALALLLSSLVAGCGPGEPAAAAQPGAAPTPGASGAIRVSGDVPLPSSGVDDRGSGAGPAGGGSAEPGAGADLAELVAALPARTVVAPRPALADPAARPGAPRPFTPRLVSRGADGKDALELPLVHTRVVAQVSGAISRVEVTQYFRNPSPDRLEAIYAFPLPPDAAVTDMLFRVGDRVVLSEVRRREEAKRVYEQARQEGRTAALTEQERPNLFTQSIANVPPGETVAVVLRYVHEVPFQDGRYQFHFPMTIGPRYVPGAPLAPGAVRAARAGTGTAPDTDKVPDASRVTPSVVPAGVRSAHDVDVLVKLVPAAAFDDVAARSHRVVTGVDAAGARLVALAEDDRVPDRDLVLSWRPAAAAPAAHALVQREKGDDWLLLFVQPPPEVAPAMVRPKELVFLLDKSGSMMGAPIERAKALVFRALDALGPDDTFQIVAFDGGAQSMTAAPIPGTPANRARAKAWLGLLQGGGGTEMLAGVRAALEAPFDPRRLRMVVFCTDGFIGNEAEIIEAVERLRGPARVFGFGIGESVNRYLVEGVARAGRGAAEVVSLAEPPDAAVERLFRRLDRPVLTELELAFEGARVEDLIPARLPDLFAGQPLVVSGRLAAGAPTALLLRGRLGEAPWQARVPVVPAPPPDPTGTAQPVAGTLWARRRVEELLSARPTAPAAAAIDEIVAHALRFKLVTPYTSFVAVERELRVDPRLPLAQALVPNELPAGVSPEGIFGPASAVEVLPARVKPGDPELRVEAPGAVAVRVALPFERAPREAVRDPRRGDFVLRFLVPTQWPDGSFDARVTVVHPGGGLEERTVPIRVDTTPAALAVLSAPARARPGELLRISVKPALPAARLAALGGRPGGLGNALKGAMEVKEVLVRAPWGEIARAELQGAAGVWTAELHVPADGAEGDGELELVASDAAGNVSRRRIPLAVGAPLGDAVPAATQGGGTVGIGILAALLLSIACGLALLRGPRVRSRFEPLAAPPFVFAPPPAPAAGPRAWRRARGLGRG